MHWIYDYKVAPIDFAGWSIVPEGQQNRWSVISLVDDSVVTYCPTKQGAKDEARDIYAADNQEDETCPNCGADTFPFGNNLCDECEEEEYREEHPEEFE